ncbi:hypothetical protein BVRB_3g051950 [Beta vulgaris subsp. vulgaris]|uniref:phosphatidylinositol 4-kinase gamma 3 n=1 Tax=Beta vulgaris subsp. vulgaris TaxID=3555 RepID=UPI0005400CBE|nr:phosphatidylinositol 4-kinase gamma 3 [Beta vulgaris subsp. vulgaris]KMT16017.1 hypothetical protein BVRB_3g051950 [Beta vulgaris subsp. vulgaris]
MSMASVALSPVQKDSLTIPSVLSGQHGYLANESILIYLTVGGSVVPIRVLESDSVASVKLRIQNHRGFFVKNQKLVFDGRELARNDSPVRDYGVANETVLHLVLRLSNIQAIIVRTVCGKEFEFHVERSRNVGYLKQQIARRGNGLFDLKDQELLCDGEELQDQHQIQEYCKNNDAVIHLIVQKSAKVRSKPVEKDFEVLILASDPNEKDDGVQPVHPLGALGKRFCREIILEQLIFNPKIELPLVIRQLISSTFSGLDKGNQPVRSSEGCGGAYFMLDPAGKNYISVFKPMDEEPMAVNNPNGLPESNNGEGLKRGTQVGGGALREVAAYILDHPRTGPRSLYHSEAGFAGIPPTALVKCLHEGFYHPDGFEGSLGNMKIGSLQMYMNNSGSCEDMGPGAFPVEEVHKISVLDIRLANADRHAGNILVSRDHEGQIVLIPIDHGYCLPSKFEDCTFDWLYWPQARQPYSSETMKYIDALDAEEDISLLKLHGWDIPPDCARVFRVSTMLLKKGVARGLTPFAIGSIICRETLNKESMIERIVREAEEALLPESSESAFLETISSVMDHWLDELSA